MKLLAKYTMSKRRKHRNWGNEIRLKGRSHGSKDGKRTLCGMTVDEAWVFTDEDYKGTITCKTCLKALKAAQERKQQTKEKDHLMWKMWRLQEAVAQKDQALHRASIQLDKVKKLASEEWKDWRTNPTGVADLLNRVTLTIEKGCKHVEVER